MPNHSPFPPDGIGNKFGSSQTKKEPVFHPNPLSIPIEFLQTSIRGGDNSLKDKFKAPVLQLTALYHFDRKLLQLDFASEGFSKTKIISSEISCKNSEVVLALDRNGDSFFVDLARRHPFDKKFFMSLKYFLTDKRGVVSYESAYQFEVKLWMFLMAAVFFTKDSFTDPILSI